MKANLNKTNKENMQKPIQMKLTLILETLPAEDGGGVEVWYEELGRYTCSGHGETLCEALESLNSIFLDMFEKFVKDEKHREEMIYMYCDNIKRQQKQIPEDFARILQDKFWDLI